MNRIMDEVAERFASETKDEEGYLSLFRVDKGAGKSTRIGIVPFGMSFEDSTTQFGKSAEKNCQAG